MSDSTPSPKPRRRRRWLKRIGLAILIIPFLAVAAFGIEWKWTRVAGQRKLDAITARLDAEDPGWRFDDIVAAHNARAAGTSNSMPTLLALIDGLPRRLPMDDADSDFAQLVDEKGPFEDLDIEWWERLELKFPAYEPTVAKLRAWNPGSPKATFPLKIHDVSMNHRLVTAGFTDPVPVHDSDSTRVRVLINLLAWDAHRNAIADRSEVALNDAAAALHLFRSVDFEPMSFTYHWRTRFETIPIESVERTLAHCSHPPEASLAVLQKLFAAESLTAVVKRCLRTDRAVSTRSSEHPSAPHYPGWGANLGARSGTSIRFKRQSQPAKSCGWNSMTAFWLSRSFCHLRAIRNCNVSAPHRPRRVKPPWPQSRRHPPVYYLVNCIIRLAASAPPPGWPANATASSTTAGRRRSTTLPSSASPLVCSIPTTASR